MAKYIVYVNEFNPNSNETVTFEESFSSLKEVTQYIRHFNYKKYCSGHVEKVVNGFSETILNF